MDATTTRTRPHPGQALSRFLGTRRGSFTVAGLTAALAAVALVAYLGHYRQQVRGGTVPTQVLLADRLIPKGTAGDAVATDRYFRPATVAADDARPLALADAAALSGKTAARDIYPGQQLTSADFTTGGDRLRGAITAGQRALAIPVDQAHGLIGDIRTGDAIDVYASFTGGTGAGRGVLRTIAQDVLVLKAPGKAQTNSSATQSVILRLSDREAATLAYAADNAKVWFALRPPAGATQSRPATVTEQSLGVTTSGGAG